MNHLGGKHHSISWRCFSLMILPPVWSSRPKVEQNLSWETLCLDLQITINTVNVILNLNQAMQHTWWCWNRYHDAEVSRVREKQHRLIYKLGICRPQQGIRWWSDAYGSVRNQGTKLSLHAHGWSGWWCLILLHGYLPLKHYEEYHFLRKLVNLFRCPVVRSTLIFSIKSLKSILLSFSIN